MPLTYIPLKNNELISKEYILNLALQIKKFINSDGVYLEAGAYDGVSQSNTLIINHKLGWTGILVEPIPKYYEACLRNRPKDIVEQVLLVEKNDLPKKLIVNLGMMSKILKNPNFNFSNFFTRILLKLARFYFGKEHIYLVNCLTINQLCSKNNIDEIHFISIDVEGFEFEALYGADLGKLNTLAILVECRPVMIMKTLELLIPKGYVLVEAMTRFNRINNPHWDGTHQDYLFLRRDFFVWTDQNK